MSIYLIAAIAYCLVCAFVAQLIHPKNGIGLILGLLFGIFGVIVAAILNTKTTPTNEGPSFYQVNTNRSKQEDEQKKFDLLLKEEQERNTNNTWG